MVNLLWKPVELLKTVHSVFAAYFNIKKFPALFFTASFGVRWMIGQTEINRGSSYGNKEVPLNNN